MVRFEACGSVSMMREGDRIDQTLFPDFERIASDGIGLVESFDNPMDLGLPAPRRPA
jgi:hypothetical protein